MTALRRGNAWLPDDTLEMRSGLRIYALPHAGGGGHRYRGWARSLPAEVQVVPVLLPGRERRIRETPFTDMAALSSAICEVILSSPAAGPFALLGLSMGALLGFETARALERIGHPPAALFVAGHRAPHLPLPITQWHKLPTPQLIEELRRLGGIPAAVLADPELLALTMQTVRADLEATETYRYRPAAPVGAPLYVYVGQGDPWVDASGAAAWSLESRGATHVRRLRGGHFLMDESKDYWLAALAPDVGAVLAGVRGAGCGVSRNALEGRE